MGGSQLVATAYHPILPREGRTPTRPRRILGVSPVAAVWRAAILAAPVGRSPRDRRIRAKDFHAFKFGHREVVGWALAWAAPRHC